MVLREEILKEHSKTQCLKIIEWIGASQDRFDELIHLFLHDEYRIVQRAAWPLSYCIIAYPSLIDKHFGRLIKNLHQPLPDAVKRNTVRLLQQLQIPEELEGEIMDICFNYIASPEEAAAIKAFALTILQNLSKKYPEILPEIKLIIEERWNFESAAFKSRAKKILNENEELPKI